MTSPSTRTGAAAISIELYSGSRWPLRGLFQLAEDSESELDGYIELGDVLVARTCATVAGYIQVIAGETARIASVAVVEWKRCQGIGTALIRAGLTRLFSAGAERVLVGTAAADIDNLRLYQRLGFRALRVERDAFTVDRGYSPDLQIDGIPIRDRIWLSIEASARSSVTK
jgi:ribosomal protein S18 acetylase RimI-like enzyme